MTPRLRLPFTKGIKMGKQKKKVVADWVIALKVECPKCGKLLDLTMEDDFWYNFEPAEDFKGKEFGCPECKVEFLVDAVY